jgi:hypothetical protein
MKNLPFKLLASILPLIMLSCGVGAEQQAKIDKLEQEVARLAAAQNTQKAVAVSEPTAQNITDTDVHTDTDVYTDYDEAQEGESVEESYGDYNATTPNWDYQEASFRLLTDSELKNINVYQLRIMRNSIFARHGYIFKSPELQRYFAQKSEYRPRYTDVVAKLTAIEKQNIEKIKIYEKLNISTPR